jgi:hypothetical protein
MAGDFFRQFPHLPLTPAVGRFLKNITISVSKAKNRKGL